MMVRARVNEPTGLGLGVQLTTDYEYDSGTVSGQTVAADPTQAIDGSNLSTAYQYDPGTVSGKTVAANPTQAIDYGTSANPAQQQTPAAATKTNWTNVAWIGVGALALFLVIRKR